jgi:hypothetical protein
MDYKENQSQNASIIEDSKGDDNYGEEAHMAIPSILKNLKGVTASDSIYYRIEAFRVHLEKLLGGQQLNKVY